MPSHIQRKDLTTLVSSLAGQKPLGGNCECFEKQALNLSSSGVHYATTELTTKRTKANICPALHQSSKERMKQHQLSTLAGRKLLRGDDKCFEKQALILSSITMQRHFYHIICRVMKNIEKRNID
jgi:hypothetical protein